MAPKGWTVVNDEAGSPQRKTKTIAEKRLPRGTSDIQALAATDIGELIEVDVLEKLDLSRLSNAKHVIKTFSIAESPYFSPHIYSGKVVLYNPKLIKDAPKGIADLWDPKNQGKVGVVDIQHNYTTMAAALVAGGQTGDFEKAKKALLDLKKLKPRIYPSNEALAQALQTEEVGLCIMWKARAVQWQNAGANILTVAPKEGIITYVSGFTDPEERAEQGGRLCLPRRRDGALRPGRLRRGHGLQPRGRQREGRARPEGAHRLHGGRREAAGQPGPRVPRQARRRAEGLLGQGVQGGLAMKARGGWRRAPLPARSIRCLGPRG